MKVTMRKASKSDLPFLREMLYEAVFWRDNPGKPSFEEALALPEIGKSLADWGNRPGDTGVIALKESVPVGAAWFRFWNDDIYDRGFVEERIPVVVIGVHSDHRRKGVGAGLLHWLVSYAAEQHIPRISLMVAKDNLAQKLYRREGFREYADKGSDLILVRDT